MLTVCKVVAYVWLAFLGIGTLVVAWRITRWERRERERRRLKRWGIGT